LLAIFSDISQVIVQMHLFEALELSNGFYDPAYAFIFSNDIVLLVKFKLFELSHTPDGVGESVEGRGEIDVLVIFIQKSTCNVKVELSKVCATLQELHQVLNSLIVKLIE